jgi:hypothetical protein
MILCVDLQLKWGLRKRCSPCQEISNGMWHIAWMQGSQGDSQLLMVKSQIGNLTPNPSSGHNLCFRYPNWSCEPILDIYVQKHFQWYKEHFNPMGFDSCNYSLKIQESIETTPPKVGAHLGVWRFIPSHSPTLSGAWNVTPRLPSWPAPSQALALDASPMLRLRHWLNSTYSCCRFLVFLVAYSTSVNLLEKFWFSCRTLFNFFLLWLVLCHNFSKSSTLFLALNYIFISGCGSQICFLWLVQTQF